MSRFMDYREAAKRVSGEYFRISPRTIDQWPDLKGRILNRKVWVTPKRSTQRLSAASVTPRGAVPPLWSPPSDHPQRPNDRCAIGVA